MSSKVLTNSTLRGWLVTLAGGIALVSFSFPALRADAQSLQLRYTFEDSGTTAASDPSGALSVPLTLLDFSGAATDLHGGAGSGVQNQGHSLDLSSAENAGTATASTINGPIAQATNNATLGSLGVVSNFTAAIWFKEQTVITNTQNRGGRLVIMGTSTVTDNNAATNGIQIYYQTANALFARINTSVASAPLYFNPLPTNVWLFLAVVYDGTNNVRLYYGTEASPAKLVSIRSIGAQTVDFGSNGGTGNLILGNRPTDRTRAFDGWIDEFRFYTGSGDAAFVEALRQASTPIVVADLDPDGASLMEGTDTLSFTASSASGIDPNGIKVAVDGTDVSSSLDIGGTSTSRTVSYSGLPVNPTLANNAPLNAVRLSIQITDLGGVTTTNFVTYDAFSPDNFTFECEDYDYADDPLFGPGGQYIDNPRYAFESASDTYWQREGLPPVDYSDTASGAQVDVYRGAFDLVATEFSVGTGPNGGPSVGDMMRQKVLDALALDDRIRDVDVGYFDSGNWQNYTRTYPEGAFNVYLRVANGGGGGSSTLDMVTGGQGTPAQTTTNLGTFTTQNTGGWQSYHWAPLRDASGNLVRLDLNGTNTLRLTAGSSGGGNINFVMLTTANTNLPIIEGVYPNGTNLFQPAANLTFTASSPVGAAINANSIQVAMTIRTILGTTTTNLTSTNGLVVTGTPDNRSVSAPLRTNATYTAVINVTDANGSPASTTVNFDTYDPVFVWEAEDYDYGRGQYIDNPTPNAYAGAAGTRDVDYHDSAAVSQNGTPVYRTADAVGLEINGDTPLRKEYIGTGFTDYDVGWYDNGDWVNYTRTYPAGQFNVYARVANGLTGSGGVNLSRVTSGVGESNQVTEALGSFSIPATGGWQTYTWIPLRDSGGNLVKFTGGGLMTLRATSIGGANMNFYALFPANTNLPAIKNISPDGSTLFQATNQLSFTVSSAAGISTNKVSVVLDGVLAPNLTFAGSASSWDVSLAVSMNGPHVANINVTDANGNSSSTTVLFDTFASTYYTWEAEDYDYDSGQFFDNPQVDAYSNLNAVADVDFHDANFGGTYLYRPNGTATEITADSSRAQFAGAYDYNIGFFGAGEWGNYTRHYPAGTYNVWGRFACGDANQSAALLSAVTGGWGTTNQTTNYLGTFLVPNTGWGSFGWVELTDSLGTPRTVTLNGSTNTFKLTRDPTPPYADVNVNFLMLVPAAQTVSLTASVNGANLVLSFPSQSGSSYYMEYKEALTDAQWTTLTNAIPGDGTVKTVNDLLTPNNRFYRLRVE